MTIIQEIRNSIKESGYSNRKVSVKDGNCRTITAVNIEIKSSDVDASKIEEITNKYETHTHNMCNNEMDFGSVFIVVNKAY